MRPALRAGALLVAAVAVTGCDAVADQVAEEAAEQVAEQAAGGDIEFNGEDGSFSVETSEGSMSFGSGQLPESFPEQVPLPEGDYQVITSFEQTGDEGLQAQVSISLAGTPDDVDGLVTYLEEGLTEAGYELDDTQRAKMGGLTTASVIGTGHGHLVTIGITAAEGDPQLLLSYGIGPPPTQ